jgi:hypothetical protein
VNTDQLLAEAVDFLEEVAPDNKALVPVSLGLERDPESDELRWACYFQVESRRWGEFETSGRAKYPPLAIAHAFDRLKREFA